jgi:hypothetical protein
VLKHDVRPTRNSASDSFVASVERSMVKEEGESIVDPLVDANRTDGVRVPPKNLERVRCGGLE